MHTRSTCPGDTQTFENKHIINITKKTVDSKIDENRRKKYEIIQVMGEIQVYMINVLKLQ